MRMKTDHCPIGARQTISQPYIVALMTDLADVTKTDVVLEIGTGSGYQAAVLSELAGRVYTIEIVEELGRRAANTLQRLGYDNVTARVGDGYAGWPDHAPFDAILVTAAPEEVPQPLIEQLAVGGRMVIPVGAEYEVQTLQVLTKEDDGQVSTQQCHRGSLRPANAGRKPGSLILSAAQQDRHHRRDALDRLADPSNTSSPHMRANFKSRATSLCTRRATSRTEPPRRTVNGLSLSAGLPGVFV